MVQPGFLSASLYVALGGALGSWLRFLAGRAWLQAIGPAASGVFPWATLSVNALGSFAMGLLAGWLPRLGGGGGEAWRLLLGVGVLGGFTTFSAFSLELAALIERGEPGLAAIYLFASLAAGLAGLFAGLILIRSLA